MKASSPAVPKWVAVSSGDRCDEIFCRRCHAQAPLVPTIRGVASGNVIVRRLIHFGERHRRCQKTGRPFQILDPFRTAEGSRLCEPNG